MTTDILEWLRVEAIEWEAADCIYFDKFTQAAAEIERLRSGRAAVIEEAEAAKEVLKIIFVPATEASLRAALERYLAARALKDKP